MPVESRIMAVWGRSYRSDGKPCSPLEATSIRFHMAAGDNFASDILRQSGFSKVSITAVKDDYRADRQYYVIWLKVSRPEVEAILRRPGESRQILSTDCMVSHRTWMLRFLKFLPKNRAGRCDRSAGIVLAPGRLLLKPSGRTPQSC